MPNIVRFSEGQNYVASITLEQGQLAERLYDRLEMAHKVVTGKFRNAQPIGAFMQVLEVLEEIAGKTLYVRPAFKTIVLAPDTELFPTTTKVRTSRLGHEEILNAASLLRVDEIKKRYADLAKATMDDPAIGRAVAEAFGIPFEAQAQPADTSVSDAHSARKNGGRGGQTR